MRIDIASLHVSAHPMRNISVTDKTLDKKEKKV